MEQHLKLLFILASLSERERVGELGGEMAGAKIAYEMFCNPPKNLSIDMHRIKMFKKCCGGQMGTRPLKNSEDTLTKSISK